MKYKTEAKSFYVAFDLDYYDYQSLLEQYFSSERCQTIRADCLYHTISQEEVLVFRDVSGVLKFFAERRKEFFEKGEGVPQKRIIFELDCNREEALKLMQDVTYPSFHTHIIRAVKGEDFLNYMAGQLPSDQKIGDANRYYVRRDYRFGPRS